MPLTHLHHTSGHRRLRRQPVQDTIVGEVAIPADFAFFGREAFPGKSGRQQRKRLALTAFSGPFVGGAMHPGIDALAPGVSLPIEATKSAKSGFHLGTLPSISNNTLFMRSVSATLGSPPKYSKASIKQRIIVGASQRLTKVTKRMRE